MLEDFLKSIPNELAKLAGAVNEAMQLTDLAWGPGRVDDLDGDLEVSLSFLSHRGTSHHPLEWDLP